MNDLSTIPLTMSTLEIAGLTGKAHAHVLADADKMLDALEIQSAEFGSAQYRDATGKTKPRPQPPQARVLDPRLRLFCRDAGQDH